MPHPRKPRQLKVISGSRQPDPEQIEFEPVDAVPAAPDWLPNAHAVKEWERLAPILLIHGLLTAAGLMAFGHLCSLHGKLVQLWAGGESPTGHMMAQYRALVNDFGLTPVAQGKVAASDRAAQSNRFRNNGKPRKP